MSTELPNVTIRPGPAPGQRPKPRKKPFSYGKLSVILTTVLLFLVAPVAVGLSIVVTESVGNTQGAMTMVLLGPVVLLLQLVCYGLAVVGLATKDPKGHMGIATFLIGLIVLGGVGALTFAALAELL